MLVDEAEDEYVLIHSPANGIGIKRSTEGKLVRRLSLHPRPAAMAVGGGRITAGHLLDLRRHPDVGKYLLTFHGATRRGRRDRAHHGEASIAIAWSDDLLRWHWPSDADSGIGKDPGRFHT